MDASRETRTARVVRGEDGIIVIRILPDVEQTPEDAADNLAAARAVTAMRRPGMIDIREARPLSAETRHYYSGSALNDTFSALALVVPAGAFGRMFGNVYLRVSRPAVPSMLFADEAPARDWLRGFL